MTTLLTGQAAICCSYRAAHLSDDARAGAEEGQRRPGESQSALVESLILPPRGDQILPCLLEAPGTTAAPSPAMGARETPAGRADWEALDVGVQALLDS